jgi:hypothetical protein
MATRYSEKTKKEVVDFVKKFDEEHGRGGQSAAKKQFKINPISIKKWCVEQGYEGGPVKKARPVVGKVGAKKGRRSSAGSVRIVATAVGRRADAPKINTTTVTLTKMAELSAKIDALQHEFDSLKQSL